jgi:DNA-binding MarR family transcriptional regulator
MSRIQHELKQNRPFSTKAQEAAVALMRTADLLRRLVGETIEPAKITAQQYNVLRILRGAGERGLPTLEIAQRMVEQTPGITRLIDRLEEKELVTRVRCLTDRRQVFCHINDTGLAMLESLDAPVREADTRALTMLKSGEVDQLIDILDRIRAALHEPDE